MDIQCVEEIEKLRQTIATLSNSIGERIGGPLARHGDDLQSVLQRINEVEKEAAEAIRRTEILQQGVKRIVNKLNEMEGRLDALERKPVSQPIQEGVNDILKGMSKAPEKKEPPNKKDGFFSFIEQIFTRELR